MLNVSYVSQPVDRNSKYYDKRSLGAIKLNDNKFFVGQVINSNYTYDYDEFGSWKIDSNEDSIGDWGTVYKDIGIISGQKSLEVDFEILGNFVRSYHSVKEKDNFHFSNEIIIGTEKYKAYQGEIEYEGYARFSRSARYQNKIERIFSGKLYDSNGRILYEGEWDDDKRNGFGKEYENGVLVYEGEWDNNSQTGEGKEYVDGYLIYEGSFLWGKYDGYGKCYYDDKKIKFEGNFVKGFPIYGCLYNQKGKIVFQGDFLERFDIKKYNGKRKPNLCTTIDF